MPATFAAEFAVDDIAAAMDYYERVLGFDKGHSLPGEDGRLAHGDISFGSQVRIVFSPSQGGAGPANREIIRKLKEGSAKGAGVLLYIDLGERDVDDYYERVISRGARVVLPLADQPWGHRNFTIRDLDGYVLTFAQAIQRNPVAH